MKKTYLKRKIFLAAFYLTCSCIVYVRESESKQVNTDTFNSFEDWCENKDNLNEDIRHTIELLLLKVKTSDCKFASKELSTYTSLSLDKRGVSNLLPLSSFTNLTRLNLTNNKIVDIKPLEKLTKLTSLGISGNHISDISPLRNMKDLTSLRANRNQISDVSPLQTLTKLHYLALNDNKIQDVTSLQLLNRLNIATFRGNPIINKICPVPKPVNDLPICAF
ncbi:leucine-rich repeat domain-containing protein [Pseudanabaena minima]|uniref:leucine-rich repeat domain-containing protein n=1 Tax=Pseudanabaena minima TaxID=890415 RepID=UPI003DA83F3B